MSRSDKDKRAVYLPQIDQKLSRQQTQVVHSNEFQNDNYNFIAPKTKKTVQIKETREKEDYSIIEELKQKNEDLRKDIETRNQTIFSIQRNFESLSQLLKSEKQESAANKDELFRQKESNLEMIKMCKTLQTKTQDQEVQLGYLRKENEQFMEDKKKNQRQSQELQQAQKYIEEQEKLMTKKTDEIANLHVRMREYTQQSEIIKGLEQARRELLATSEKQAKKNTDQEVLLNNQVIVKNEIFLQKTQLEQFHIQINKFIQQANETKNDKEQYQAEFNKMKFNSNELLKEITSQAQLIQQQNQQIKYMMDNIDTNNTMIKMKSDLESSHKQALLELNQKLSNSENRFKEKSEESDQSLVQLKQLQSEMAFYVPHQKLLKDYTELQQQCNDEIKLIPQFELKQLNTNISTLQNSYILLQKEYKALHGKNENTNLLKQNMEDQSITQLATIKRLESELQDYQESLQASGQNSDLLKKLQDKLSNSQQTQIQLEKDNHTYKQTIINQTQEITQLQEHHRQNVDKIRNFEQNLEDQNHSLTDRENEVTQLKQRLNDKMKQSDELNAQIELSLERQRQFEWETQELKDQYEDKLRGTQTIQGKNDQEIQKLQSTNSNLQKNIESKDTQLKQLELKMQSQQNESNEQLIQLKIDMQMKDSEIQKLNVEISTKTQIYKMSQQELIQRDEQVYQSNLNLKSLQNRFNQVQKELEDLNPDAMRKNISDFQAKETEFKSAIAKIEHAQEATVISISCSNCMEYLNQTVTCVPCGHSFCQTCLKQQSCTECSVGKDQFKNKQMDDIVAKIKYSLQTIKSIKGL